MHAALVFAIVLSLQLVAARNSLAKTPPMGCVGNKAPFLLSNCQCNLPGFVFTNYYPSFPPCIPASCCCCSWMSWEIFRCNLNTSTDDCTDKATTRCISEALYQGITDSLVSSGLASVGYSSVHMDDCVSHSLTFILPFSHFSHTHTHTHTHPHLFFMAQKYIIVGGEEPTPRPRNRRAPGGQGAVCFWHEGAWGLCARCGAFLCHVYCRELSHVRRLPRKRQQRGS